MSDDYQFWREALAGRDVDIIEDRPQPGYYKTRKGKSSPWLPVAIWRKDGELVARVADKMEKPHDIWVWCAKHPVNKDDARHAFANGNTWPGDVPQTPTARVGGIGDNSMAIPLPEEIDDAVASATEWLSKTKIDSDQLADQCANWRSRLLQLSKDADAKRVTEKAPHDKAAKAVQEKWKPFIDKAEATAVALRNALTPYLAAKERRLREESDRKAREENARRIAEYERQQREQRDQEDARKAQAAAAPATSDAPTNAPAEPVVEAPQLPIFVAPEPVKVAAGGQRGRKAGLRTITVYETTDYAALLAHVKDHPDVVAVVEKVGKAQAKTGAVVPGITSKQEHVAA